MKRLQHCHLRVPCAVAAATLLSGCAATGSPEWDARFGDGVRQINAQQLLDPAAPQRNAAAKGKTDGRSAREARERYVDSYASPPTGNGTTGAIAAGK